MAISTHSKVLLENYTRYAIKYGRVEPGSRVESKYETLMHAARSELEAHIEALERRPVHCSSDDSGHWAGPSD